MLNLDQENILFQKGHKIVCGIDEAGRGPLAGPVVAAAVTLKPEIAGNIFAIKGMDLVKDSKKLTAQKRAELFEIITKEFCDFGIGICDNQTIDRINILQATFLAMKKAVGALKEKPDFLLIDGKFPIPNYSLQQNAIIHGDDVVFSIAAASIIAKVTRDRLMQKIHQQYPHYGFDRHKGYGTKIHLEAIRQHGACPIHRKSFKPISQFIEKSVD